MRHSIAAMRPPDSFKAYPGDARILYELGAEKYADIIAHLLPSAIEQVEKGQYRPFAQPVRVYICSSRKSFKKYYGADVRAGVLTKLFLSPLVFDQGEDVTRQYLVHELSHLHLRDHIGQYKMVILPLWFKEGLATYVSKGGGAHTVSVEEATDAIKAGKHFVPSERGSIFFPKKPSSWGIKPQMYYRQSMIFTQYLIKTDPAAFRTLLLSIEDGKRFTTAFESTYKMPLAKMWGHFLKDID